MSGLSPLFVSNHRNLVMSLGRFLFFFLLMLDGPCKAIILPKLEAFKLIFYRGMDQICASPRAQISCHFFSHMVIKRVDRQVIAPRVVLLSLNLGVTVSRQNPLCFVFFILFIGILTVGFLVN